MQAVGGHLSLRALLGVALLACASQGCVRDAVLENDVRKAQAKRLVLATQSDLELAQAALSSQLVELEALFQQAPQDKRVLRLLAEGYFRMAGGFIEAQRLEAIAAGDLAETARHQERKRLAEARAVHYRAQLGPIDANDFVLAVGAELGQRLGKAELACRAHERTRYETELTSLLAQRDTRPETQLDLALAQRLARGLLHPEVAARCSPH